MDFLDTFSFDNAPKRRLVTDVLDICAARIKLRVSSEKHGLSARGGSVA